MQSLDRNSGIIFNVNRENGFGFIKVEGKNDQSVFVHISEINPKVSNDEFKTMENSRVFFEIVETEKGLVAQNVGAK